MNRILLAGVTALAVIASSQAFAEGVGVGVGPGGVSAGITFAPEQRTRIKEYVVKERVAPVRERITVGATVPAAVELHTVPADWGPSVSRYRYVYSNDNIYFVEPDSRRVVHVID
jgi:hypothetical protein